jgi:hypothetical protein
MPSCCGLWPRVVLEVVLAGGTCPASKHRPDAVRIDSGTVNLTEE